MTYASKIERTNLCRGVYKLTLLHKSVLKITINFFELYYQEFQLSFALKLYHHCHTKQCLF